MSYFSSYQEDRLAKIKVLLQLAEETSLYTRPCPLLQSQLEELKMILSRAIEEVRQLLEDKTISGM